MGKSVNKVILLGHVGKAPEMRVTGGGTVVANLSIALSDRQKNDQGEWVDKTEWVNLIAFKRTAEIIRDYVTKGSKIYVEGKLQTSSNRGRSGTRPKCLFSMLRCWMAREMVLDSPRLIRETSGRMRSTKTRFLFDVLTV